MSVQKKKLTVLFTPLDGWGHINCCHGLAEELLNRGHRVIFTINEAFKGKLSPFGFEEILLTTPAEEDQNEKWSKIVEELSVVFESLDPSDVAVPVIERCRKKMIDDVILLDSQYEDIIKRVDPDLIVVDNYVNNPAITNSGRPWIWLYSAAPLSLYKSDDLPPERSGFPINDSDKTKWNIFRQKISKAIEPSHKRLNEFCVSRGAPPLPPNDIHPSSPFLNIYIYIKELDYSLDGYNLPQNFLRVDNLIRTTDERFEIPDKLLKRCGGLLFLSLGSFNSANLKLMTRLIRILSKSKHRFIVSKGPRHNQFELPDNMWGNKYVPQLAVLPLVDAVICHGGNNTLTESFYYGKPALIMPIDGDQYDNAQRIIDTKLGLRLNPFHCTQQQLLESVDKLITDQILIQKCKAIGERMRYSNDKKKVVDIIENSINNI